MDDLDRLYVQLVELIRRDQPDALDHPMTVAELYGELIPYQRIREATGFRSYDEYETALSRLLAGERGYLSTDALDMQAEIAAGLEETYPDVRRFHAFADAEVKLDPKRIPPPGHIRYAPPEVQEQAMLAAEAERKAREEARKQAEAEARAKAERERLEEERKKLEAERRKLAEARTDDDRGSVAANTEPARAPRLCGCCDSGLPDQALKFCPFCGERLNYTCSACGAAMEPGWKFCGECGSPHTKGSSDSA